AHDVHARRHDGADVDREVHVADARHVPGREHRFADRGLLLRGHVHAAARRADARAARRIGRRLALGRRSGLALLLGRRLLGVGWLARRRLLCRPLGRWLRARRGLPGGAAVLLLVLLGLTALVRLLRVRRRLAGGAAVLLLVLLGLTALVRLLR